MRLSNKAVLEKLADDPESYIRPGSVKDAARWALDEIDKKDARIAALEKQIERAAYALEVASDWMPEIQIDDGTWKGTFTLACELKSSLEKQDD